MGSYVIDSAAVAGLDALPSIDSAVEGYAEDIYDESQGRVPVDTGELRASGFVDGHASEYRIGYGTDHARYVEFGTSEMDAQPYLTPSALRYRG